MKIRRKLFDLFLFGLLLTSGLFWMSRQAGPRPIATTVVSEGKLSLRLMEVKEGLLDFPGVSPNSASWPIQMLRGLTRQRIDYCPPFTTRLPHLLNHWELPVASFRFDWTDPAGRASTPANRPNFTEIWFEEPDGSRIGIDLLSKNSFGNVLAFSTTAVPRRHPTLVIAFKITGYESPFRISLDNPFHKPVQQEWIPEPLPAARTVPGETITLKGLRKTPGQKVWPELTYGRDGQFRNAMPRYWLQDVTGNLSPWDLFGVPQLSLNEPAWKLIVTFNNSEPVDLPNDIVWTSPEFPAPGIGVYHPLKTPVDLQGVSVETFGLFGGGLLELKGQKLVPAPAGVQPKTLAPPGQFRSDTFNNVTTFTLSQPCAVFRIPKLAFPEELIPELVVDGQRHFGSQVHTSTNGVTYEFIQFPQLAAEAKIVQLRLTRRRLPTAEFLIAPPQELKNQTN